MKLAVMRQIPHTNPLSHYNEAIAWAQDRYSTRKTETEDLIRKSFVPPQEKKVRAMKARAPLTDERIDELRFSFEGQHHTERDRKLVRLVEQWHGIGKS